MKLTINEKEFPLQWGFGAIEMFCDTLDCEVADIDKAFTPGKDQIRFLTTLIHCALKNGADVENYFDAFEVSYRQLQKFLDDAPQDTVANIIEDFKKSKYLGKTVAVHMFGELEEAETGNPEEDSVKKKSSEELLPSEK